MEPTSPQEENKLSNEEIAYGYWHKLDSAQRNPPLDLPEIQEEDEFLRTGLEAQAQAVEDNIEKVRRELENDRTRIEGKVGHKLPSEYHGIIFTKKHIADNFLGWALKKYDPSQPEKFAFWYQLFLGSNFVLEDLRNPFENLWGRRSQLPGLVFEELQMKKRAENPDNPTVDPEEVTLGIDDEIKRALELEKLLQKDPSGLLLAQHGLDRAIRFGIRNNYRFLHWGADAAYLAYKQINSLLSPNATSES